jgi:hypothetical protein
METGHTYPVSVSAGVELGTGVKHNNYTLDILEQHLMSYFLLFHFFV